MAAHIGPFAGYFTYHTKYFCTPALVYLYPLTQSAGRGPKFHVVFDGEAVRLEHGTAYRRRSPPPLCLCHRYRHRHARSMGGLGYLPRGFVLLWGCRIGHTAQFVCSAEGLISSLSLIADGENQELGPI